MNQTEGTMEKLQTFAREGREHLERGRASGLDYVSDIVVPELQNVLPDRCGEIEERHKLKEPKDRQENFVIHYTSLDTLVSMLQQEAKNRQDVAKDKQDVAKDEQESSKDEQNASLRLYDSVHFNDPGEGNYLVHNLLPPNNDESNYLVRNQNPPKTYGWSDPPHADHPYIASFTISDSDDKEDMSDNLVFWRTYGKEGEGCSLKLRIPSCRLRKVFYGIDEMECTKQILRPVLDSLSPLTSITDRVMKKDIREKLAGIFCESFKGIRYLYKSEAYKHERECRFIIHKSDIDENKICFEYKERDNSPRIRHYYEDEALAIKKILTSGSAVTLGPRVPYQSDVSNCLKIMRDRAGLEHRLEIKISKIFYRKP